MSKLIFDIELSRKSNANLKQGNQIISSNDRHHRFIENEIKKYLRNLGKEICEKNKPKETFSPEKPCNITITISAPTSRRMDPPNLYPTVKALIDGMTDAGLWIDDNYTVIQALTFKYGGKSGHKNYVLRFEIEEIKAEVKQKEKDNVNKRK